MINIDSIISKYSLKADSFIRLFSSCVPVKGARRSTICDLGDESYHFIPNSLYVILDELKKEKAVDVLRSIDSENLKFVDEYLTFLFDNNFCFVTSEPNRFPDLNLDWRSPHKITNAIIDVNESSNHDYKLVVSELDSVGCVAIQMRFYFAPSLKILDDILTTFLNSRVRSIEIVVGFSADYTDEDLVVLVSKHLRITDFILTSSSNNRRLEVPDKSRNKCILFTDNVVKDESCCGVISKENFRVNLPFLSESKNFNSCLNRKVGIDSLGNVKNCPSSSKSFGKLKANFLINIVDDSEFTRNWTVTKDSVAVCKDCEFRYICTDCRVFTKWDKVDEKPSRCTYDPYNAKWT